MEREARGGRKIAGRGIPSLRDKQIHVLSKISFKSRIERILVIHLLTTFLKDIFSFFWSDVFVLRHRSQFHNSLSRQNNLAGAVTFSRARIHRFWRARSIFPPYLPKSPPPAVRTIHRPPWTSTLLPLVRCHKN